MSEYTWTQQLNQVYLRNKRCRGRTKIPRHIVDSKSLFRRLIIYRGRPKIDTFYFDKKLCQYLAGQSMVFFLENSNISRIFGKKFETLYFFRLLRMDISYSNLLFEFGLIQSGLIIFARFRTFSTFWQFFHFCLKCFWWSPYKLTSKFSANQIDPRTLSGNHGPFSRDQRTKTDWSRTEKLEISDWTGPRNVQKTRTGPGQKYFEKLEQGRTRIKKFWKSRAGPGPMKNWKSRTN